MADDRPDSSAKARVPFWAHQLAELLLGVVLLFEGARTNTHVAVVVAGVVLIFFALMTEGPLCAWPVIPRRRHRIGDVVFAVVLAASPFLLGIDESIAIVLLEVAALVVLWLAWKSDFRPPAKRRFLRKERSAQPPAPAAPAPPSSPSPSPSPPAPSATREALPEPVAKSVVEPVVEPVAEPTPDPGEPVPEPEVAPRPPSAPKPPPVPSARDAGRALGRLRTGGVRAAGRALGKASAERSTEKAAREKPAPDGRDEPSPE